MSRTKRKETKVYIPEEKPWRKDSSEWYYTRANRWIKKLTNKKLRNYPFLLQNKLYRLLYDRDWTIW